MSLFQTNKHLEVGEDCVFIVTWIGLYMSVPPASDVLDVIASKPHKNLANNQHLVTVIE